MKHIFILNSFTDYNTNEVANKIIMACVNMGYDYIIEINDELNSTEDILNKYKDKECIIYAVGGDGMINRVLNGVVNTNNTLGYIPMGTGNDLNRTVNKDLKDGINNIDVVSINDKYFVNVACFGIDAEISNDDSLVHSEFIPKSQRYNIAALKHFFTFKPYDFEVVIDGEVISGKYSTICACNAAYYGGGYNIAPTANLQDGLMDLYLVDKLNKLQLANTILKMKNGNHLGMTGVNYEKAKRLLLFSKELIKANIDGEVIEGNTFNIKVLPNKIKLNKDEELIKRVLKK